MIKKKALEERELEERLRALKQQLADAEAKLAGKPAAAWVWLRRKKMRERYNCGDMALTRAVRSGRLPQPSHPFGNLIIPAWRSDVLDAWDAAAVAKADAERKTARSKHIAEMRRDQQIEAAANARKGKNKPTSTKKHAAAIPAESVEVTV
jgi:hypothetical protein